MGLKGCFSSLDNSQDILRSHHNLKNLAIYFCNQRHFLKDFIDAIFFWEKLEQSISNKLATCQTVSLFFPVLSSTW